LFVCLSPARADVPAALPPPPHPSAQALPPGEPWQRHVLLKAPTWDGLSGATLEGWLARRVLRHGRCHFCCRWVVCGCVWGGLGGARQPLP
jgi:hypothetical protein